METVIEGRGLSRDYGPLKALDRLQFEVSKGQCIGVAGGPGAGKTTLIRLLAAILPPSSGELFVLDLNTKTNARTVRERVGVLPERDGLDPDLTVFDNLVVFGGYFGVPARELRTRAKGLLRHVQLDETEEWYAGELRRGQARRLALARAMVNDPEILLLDSPARDLTPSERQMMWAAIEKIRTRGQTMVVASRDLDELERLCDRVIILDKGRIACQGQPETLVHQHVGREVVEYDIASQDLEYHLQALGGKYQFQVLANRLKVFIPENTDMNTVMRWVPSERVVFRRARLRDVYVKLLGHDIGGAPF
jgi:lipooligosaccharide transport system ATP-binding protein